MQLTDGQTHQQRGERVGVGAGDICEERVLTMSYILTARRIDEIDNRLEEIADMLEKLESEKDDLEQEKAELSTAGFTEWNNGF